MAARTSEAWRGGGVASAAALAGAASLALYVPRLCPDLALIGDSAELVTGAALWGVPHPPGYPLYTAIGRVFTALPLGTVPWRVHLASAVFHACAVASTVLAAGRVTRSITAALAAGVTLALARSFVAGSLYAEVFPLNDALFAASIALALRARDSPARRVGPALVALAICAGVAAGHHMMAVLGWPALLALTLRPAAAHVAGDGRRSLALAAALAAPVVASFGLVPLAAARSPYLSWGDVHDVASLVHLVTRADYGGIWSPALHPSDEPAAWRLAALAEILATSMGRVTLGIAALGVVAQLRTAPAVGTALALAVALPGPIFAWLNALGTSTEANRAYFARFTTMSEVAMALAFGAGVHALGAVLARSLRRGAGVAMATAVLSWAALRARAAANVDLHGDWTGIRFAHDLVLSTPDRSLLLLSGDQPGGAALYVCGVERRCGGRVALMPGTLAMPWSMAQTRARHPDLVIPWTAGPALRRTHELAAASGDRPVFVYPDLLAKDPLLASTLETVPDGLLYRVWPRSAPEDAVTAAFLASAGNMAARADDPWPVPVEEAPLGLAYEAAYENHARIADAMGQGPLARTLEAHALAWSGATEGQGGGRSRSR